MQLIIKIYVEPTGKAPSLGRQGDAGLDLYADCSAGSFTLEAGQTAKIPLGFRYSFFQDLDPERLMLMQFGEEYADQIYPTDDYYLEIRNRSGFGTKECVTELASICDSSYRGIPHYSIAKVAGTTTQIVHHQKVCQALIHPFIDPHKVRFEFVSTIEELGESTRGANGFNSSGSF
jgi:dUTPase